jgi:hypothetical protein
MDFKMLPVHISKVAKSQSVLVYLVALSNKPQANQNEHQKETEQEQLVMTDMQLKIQFHEDVKNHVEELSWLGYFVPKRQC